MIKLSKETDTCPQIIVKNLQLFAASKPAAAAGQDEWKRREVNMAFLWLALVAAFALVEGLTFQLVTIWFSIGSVGGLIAAVAGASVRDQIIIALAISAISLLLLRRFVMKFLKPKETKTNADSLIGRVIIIDETVDNIKNEGTGKINGLTWKLRSEDGAVIEKGEMAEIREISGVTLIVKRKTAAVKV